MRGGQRVISPLATWPQVMVLDFDLHHGNGTADIFAEDPSVRFGRLQLQQSARALPPVLRVRMPLPA